MHFLFTALLATAATTFAQAAAFPANSPVPAQLQGQILDAAVKECGAGNWAEHSTETNEAAGETYFLTVLVNGSHQATVISGIGRLGGFGVINVDCAK